MAGIATTSGISIRDPEPGLRQPLLLRPDLKVLDNMGRMNPVNIEISNSYVLTSALKKLTKRCVQPFEIDPSTLSSQGVQ